MEASRLEPPPVLDDATFDHLVRTHRSPLERYARSLGASPEDAEEIAATALLRAYQHPPVARHEQEWRAWLSTVTQNLWIDARRRRQLRLVAGDGVLEAVPSTGGSADQVAATAEEARQICAAIALLPPMQRAAIYLREVRGHSYEEIADELGITLKAVTATPAPRTGRGAAPPWRNRTGAGGRGDLARQLAPPGRERSAARDGVGNERRRPDRAPGRPRGGSGRGGDRRPAHARRHAAHAHIGRGCEGGASDDPRASGHVRRPRRSRTQSRGSRRCAENRRGAFG